MCWRRIWIRSKAELRELETICTTMMTGGRGRAGGGRGRGGVNRSAVNAIAAEKITKTRSLVWTPAIAAQAQAAAHAGSAISRKEGASSSSRSTAAAVPSSAIAGASDRGSTSVMMSVPPSLPPAVEARTSIRRAAETVELASKQSANDIEAHLRLMETRLAQVRAQEDEVRTIANEHLNREAELTKLLADLLSQHRREEALAKASVHTQPVLASAATVSSESDGNDKRSTPGGTLSIPAAPTPEAALGSPRREYRNQGTSPRTLKSKGAGSSSAGSSSSGIADPGPAMLLAMAVGGPGDALLTRDAATIEDYVLLMSAEALGEEQATTAAAGGGVGREGPVLLNERCRQPGLSMSEALDRAYARSARPLHLPNLLPFAAVMRQPYSSTVSDRETVPTAAGGKRKGDDGVVTGVSNSTCPSVVEKADISAVAAARGGGAQTAAVLSPRGGKRRRIDPNAIMCPFELNGVCNDDDCMYQHMDAFRTDPSPPPASDRTTVADTTTVGAPRPTNNGTVSSPAGSDNRSKDRPVSSGTSAAASVSTAPAPSSSSSSTGGRTAHRNMQHVLPEIQFEKRRVETGLPQQHKVPRSSGGSGGGVDVADGVDDKSGGKRASCSGDKANKSETGGKELGAASGRSDGGEVAGEGGPVHDAGSGDVKEVREKNGSNDGEDGDFLALPTEVDASVDTEAAVGDYSVVNISPAVLAKSFAQAASPWAGGSSAGGAGGGKTRGGPRREERYYGGEVDDEGGSRPTASVALTEDQLIDLEARLSEDEACDVEGWLLVAMHRLPRNGSSATAVLKAIRAATRGLRGPNEMGDDAALKPALRVLVKGIEKCEQGQAEELWALYLTLYALVPGFAADALSMAEEAIDNFFSSRRMWRLYRCILQRSKSGKRQSLGDKISPHWHRIGVLLEPPTDLDDEDDLSSIEGAANSAAVQEPGPKVSAEHSKLNVTVAPAAVTAAEPEAQAAAEDGSGVGSVPAEASSPGDMKNATDALHSSDLAPAEELATAAAAASTKDEGAGEVKTGEGSEQGTLGSDTLGMMAYLVLERCSLLVEAGYVLQATAEVLEALGETKSLRGWCDEGSAGRSLVQVQGHSEGGRKIGEGGGGANGGTNGEVDIGEHLPQGTAEALRAAPRETRCLLWVTALHLLVIGEFPAHALMVAEDVGCTGDSVADAVEDPPASHRSRGDVLQWPKEWLSPDSSAGKRLAASAELRESTHRTFMSALQDAELLPSTNGRGGGWAPPLRVEDALLPSAVEAHAARAAGMAPVPSALQGASLALALNWLTFCCRRGKDLANEQQEVRTVALACCRRFQLARPDHSAFLEHALLEHDVVWKNRSLVDVYREISHAFGEQGAAEAARREREDKRGATVEGVSLRAAEMAEVETLSPSGSYLEAVHAFLRFVEAHGRDQGVKVGGGAGAEAADLKAVGTPTVVREALMNLWVKPSKQTRLGSKVTTDAWLQNSEEEWLRRAVDGAKGSLFRWADSGGGDDEGILSAERQLSTLFVALWVLGGPQTATGTLDHVLSAESFSNMSPERRRLSWLQRLHAAVVLSDYVVGMDDSMHGVREVALRALADSRARPRPGFDTLADYVARNLEQRPGDKGGAADKVFLSAASASWFAHDVLLTYANQFWKVKSGGVDWVVVSEALDDAESFDNNSNNNNRRSNGDGRNGNGGATPPPAGLLALLRWVNWADTASEGGQSPSDMESTEWPTAVATALRSSACPYAEKAIAKHGTGDPGLAGTAAALEAATGRPDRAQRVLEAALGERPLCSALWELRLALEAAFGRKSRERARTTAQAAASTGTLLRLRCDANLASSCHRNNHVDVGQTVGRVLGAVSNPFTRRDTKSLYLQSLLGGGGDSSSQQTNAANPPPQVPRSLFLLTRLVSLSLAGNGLVALPAMLGNALTALRSLDASKNALTTLPPTLSRLSGSLRVLRLSRNRLASPLADSPLAHLANLRVLDLESNALSEFPAVVLGLSELRTLRLAHNQFPARAPAKLSDALSKLEELTLPTD